jgi:hypothetical protein
VVLGGGGAVIFIALYYGVCRPRLTSEEIRITEAFRGIMGLWGRIAYGGVVEEVMMRWGVMSVLAWLLGTNLILNGWAALIFSWLFWKTGLEAAMMAHALFHVIWYPFDVRHTRRISAQKG